MSISFNYMAAMIKDMIYAATSGAAGASK